MTEAKAENPTDGALVGAARKVERGIGKAKDVVSEKVEKAKAGVKEGAEALKSKSLGDLCADTKGFVQENPGKSVLIALGVGVLAGMLLRRR